MDVHHLDELVRRLVLLAHLNQSFYMVNSMMVHHRCAEENLHRVLGVHFADEQQNLVVLSRGAHLPYLDEVRQLPALLTTPQVMNIVVGGKTPTLVQSELAALGYGMVLYANTGLQGALLGMQKALGVLRADGIVHEDPSLLVPFLERQRLVNKPAFDAMDKKYGA